MDCVNCVICLSEKASCFCRNCKQSSGVCWDCYNELDERQDDGEAYSVVKCVICKVPMDKVKINFLIKYDLEMCGGELDDFDDNKISALKQQRLNYIISSSQFDDWQEDAIKSFSKRHRQLIYTI